MTWQIGRLEPWWDDSFKNLDYRYYPLKNTHDLVRWINQGYHHLNLNGGLYDMSREMPDYAQGFFDVFPWQNLSISFYRMLTGDALPLHYDIYTSYRKRFNVKATQMYRAIVFLEDWKSGHYFEIDSQPLMPWKAGDWVYWNNSVPHYAGTFGTEPRYTLQITGHT